MTDIGKTTAATLRSHTDQTQHFERGRRLALDGGSPPPRPGYDTPWCEWMVWRGYQSAESADGN